MKPTIVHLASRNNPTAQESIQKFICQTEVLLSGENRTVWFGSGLKKAQKIDAEIIVSHLPVRWSSFPFFVGLRALNPNSRIIHVEHAVNSDTLTNSNSRLPRSIALLRITYSLFDRVVHDTRNLSDDLTLLAS